MGWARRVCGGERDARQEAGQYGILKRKEADMTAQELLKRYKAGELVFKNADLRGVDLSYQDLRRICLYGADLTGAKLINTNLTDADLRYARFDGADLHYANLTGSNRQ